MVQAGLPTLDDLRDLPQPCWLWDNERARIVWANKASIAYFGGETLFDLLDRLFDPTEAGVENLAAMAKRLRRGETRKALLHFPSTGASAPFSCQVGLHTLPDGRTGILVAGLADGVEYSGQSGELARAFSDLPFPALLLSQGMVTFANSAADRLFPIEQRGSISRLLGGTDAAQDFLHRVTAAGTLGMTKKLNTAFGERDIRLTAKFLTVEKGAEAVILLLCEDITDRRAFERHLGAASTLPPAPVKIEPGLSAADAQAFEAVGKSLADAKPPKPSQGPVKVHAVPTTMTGLPPVVTRKIDSFLHPVIIVQDERIHYANPAALKLLRFATLEGLQQKMIFPGGPPRGVSTAKLATGDGSILAVSLTAQPIAWRNGPALQVTLTEPQGVVVDRVENISATPPSQSKADIIDFRDIPASRPKAEKAGEKSEPKSPRAEVIIEPAKEEPQPLPRVPDPVPQPQQTPKAEAFPAKTPAEFARGSAIAADDELRNILDTAADGIITLDGMGNIRTFSAGAEAIFGYRIAEVIERPLATLLAADSRRVLRDYLSALQGPGLATVFNDGREVTAVVKQGGVVPLFLTIGKLHSTTPRSAAFCAVLRDITQWKRTEAELREAKDLAEQASRQKSEFLAKISHELRTPLNAILGFSEVMRMERFGEIQNEKYRGYVNDIHASGAHLLSLINDLLDLSKVEAGKLELNFTSVALTEVIEHAVKMVQEQATAARVILRRTIPADLPNVVADYRSMSQIMLNLLTNAIKFTDPGGQIIISAQLTKAGELKLRVKDTGLGMTEAEIREALEPFRRITTDGRDVPGTGLGLPLTKALAEANRASFVISSEPRKGTLIEITFPTTRVLAV